jgi:hypothetical protein
MISRALWQAAAIWLSALVLMGLAALAAFLVTPAHAQARLDNLATGTSQTTIIGAPSGARVNYVTAAQWGRTDAGTSAILRNLQR